MPAPSVFPAQVECGVIGMKARSQIVQLDTAPSASHVTARIERHNAADIDVVIARMTVYRVETREVEVDTGPGELGPGIDPPVVTVFDFIAVGQSDGSVPLAVEPEHIVKIEVIGQPLNLAFERTAATLHITGDSWD